MIRRHISFRGRVQGVGFRYRACRAAAEFGCTGWVRNEYDGSVSMEIQGTEEQIGQGRYVRIDSVESRDIPADETESVFWAE